MFLEFLSILGTAQGSLLGLLKKILVYLLISVCYTSVCFCLVAYARFFNLKFLLCFLFSPKEYYRLKGAITLLSCLFLSKFLHGPCNYVI